MVKSSVCHCFFMTWSCTKAHFLEWSCLFFSYHQKTNKQWYPLNLETFLRCASLLGLAITRITRHHLCPKDWFRLHKNREMCFLTVTRTVLVLSCTFHTSLETQVHNSWHFHVNQAHFKFCWTPHKKFCPEWRLENKNSQTRERERMSLFLQRYVHRL